MANARNERRKLGKQYHRAEPGNSAVKFPKRLTALVVGHSFIKSRRQRLINRARREGVMSDLADGHLEEAKLFPLYLLLSRLFLAIHMLFTPLLDDDFAATIDRAGEIKPHVAVLWAGSNDLKGSHSSPHAVARELILQARRLISEFGVKEVVVLTCIRREAGIEGSAAAFDKRRVIFNKVVKELARKEPHVSVYTAKGFTMTPGGKRLRPFSELSRDNIHPNRPAGVLKANRVFRGAMLAAAGAFRKHVTPGQIAISTRAMPPSKKGTCKLRPAALRALTGGRVAGSNPAQ